jgi:hypothetical protein
MILLVVESSKHFPGSGMNTLNLYNLEPLIQILYGQNKACRSRFTIRDFPVLISDGYAVVI